MTRAPSHLATPWVRTEEDLFWMDGVGHETRVGDRYFFDCRTRADQPHDVLQLTLSGEGLYERDGVRTVLRPGMAFLDLIPGDFRYGCLAGARPAYEHVFVTFSGSASRALCGRITDEFGHVLELGSSGPVQSMMLAVAHQFEQGLLRDRYAVSGSLYQLLMAVLSTLKHRELATSPLLGRAIALVHDLSRDPALNVQALAARLRCSREHLTRQFRESMGVSAGEYIAQRRLGLSASLLRRTEHKLEVVARQCGFASANYFCRVFRKHYGITPAQLRRTPWVFAR